MELSFTGKFHIEQFFSEIIQESVISDFMEHDLCDFDGGL